MSKEREENHLRDVIVLFGNVTCFQGLELRLLSLTEEKEPLVMRLLRVLEYVEEFLDDLESLDGESLNRQYYWMDRLRRFIDRFRSFLESYETEDEDSFVEALDEWLDSQIDGDGFACQTIYLGVASLMAMPLFLFPLNLGTLFLLFVVVKKFFSLFFG